MTRNREQERAYEEKGRNHCKGKQEKRHSESDSEVGEGKGTKTLSLRIRLRSRGRRAGRWDRLNLSTG